MHNKISSNVSWHSKKEATKVTPIMTNYQRQLYFCDIFNHWMPNTSRGSQINYKEFKVNWQSKVLEKHDSVNGHAIVMISTFCNLQFPIIRFSPEL